MPMQNSDVEENPKTDASDKPTLKKQPGGNSSVSDALFIAAINPAATHCLIEGASTIVPYEALAHTSGTLGAIAVTAGHAFVEGSAVLAHLAADAASSALHALADLGDSAATLGANALHVAGEAGSTALHALAEGGSTAIGVAAEVGAAIIEHGGAALVVVGEAVVSGGTAIVAGAVAVGELVGELASAVS